MLFFSLFFFLCFITALGLLHTHLHAPMSRPGGTINNYGFLNERQQQQKSLTLLQKTVW